jgi:hypothetical protein
MRHGRWVTDTNYEQTRMRTLWPLAGYTSRTKIKYWNMWELKVDDYSWRNYKTMYGRTWNGHGENWWRQTAEDKMEYKTAGRNVKEKYTKERLETVFWGVKLEALCSTETLIMRLPTSPHGVTTQKTNIDIFTIDRTSDLMYLDT